MAFQEFFADANSGSNLNGGYPASGGIYPKSYTNGNYNATTNVFTPAGGANPQTDGITVGDWAALYNDGASSPTGCIARISARNSTTITFDLFIGTEPTTSATGRTCVVGGS